MSDGIERRIDAWRALLDALAAVNAIGGKPVRAVRVSAEGMVWVEAVCNIAPPEPHEVCTIRAVSFCGIAISQVEDGIPRSHRMTKHQKRKSGSLA